MVRDSAGGEAREALGKDEWGRYRRWWMLGSGQLTCWSRRSIVLIQLREAYLLNGFYVGYMSATAGYGVVLFVFQDDVIVGVDAGGVKFDGNFLKNEQDGTYQGNIRVDAPPNISLVQGIDTGPNGIKYSVPFSLPSNFLDAPFITMETPFGAVNVKLEKLRDLAVGP